jgi:hypothetical protein
MKQRFDRAVFRRSRLIPVTAALALWSAALSGCGSATVEQAAPTASTAAVSGISTGEPKDTGTFPNLNVPPQAATTQISPEEKQAQFEELRAAQQGQVTAAASAKPPADPALLRKLAATHAADALKTIETGK